MQYARVRRGSAGDANADEWDDGSDNELNSMQHNRNENVRMNPMELEQWQKQRVRKLTVAGLFFLSSLIILLVVARTNGDPDALSGGSGDSKNWNKVIVRDSNDEPYKCGFQDSAYYTRKGSVTNRWLIYLGSSTEGSNVYAPGGGICASAEECKSIAHARPEEITEFEGILSSSEQNPFSEWQVVFVPWCSGFAFTTGMTKDFTDEPTLLAQGSDMLDKVMQNLPTTNAEVVVLAGSGTGGIQAFMRANVLQADTGAQKVMVIADSAYLLNNSTTNIFEDAYGTSMSHLPAGTTPNLPTSCTNQVSQPWMCLWTDEFLQHSPPDANIPVFVVQSLYDTWALKNVVQGDDTCFNPLTFAPDASCDETSHDLELAHAYKSRIKEGLNEAFNVVEGAGPENLGMWIITCPSHGLLMHDETYLNPEPSQWRVQHKDLDDAIGAWVEDNLKADGPTNQHIFFDSNEWSSDLQCPTLSSKDI